MGREGTGGGEDGRAGGASVVAQEKASVGT